VHEELPEVRAHEILMQHLFQNLISNAIKYRNEQLTPVVQVGAVRQDQAWLFSVRDNGIGIKAEYQQRVFGLFKRLHSSSKYPGTGLGLAICKRIVERYGGKIWVESELGAGSTFYFTLRDPPLANATVETPIVDAERQLGIIT
jgi:light-regulated signal transduction histidine kinase (bacteriophytochrome)